MNQPPLFDLDAVGPLPSRGRLDAESEAFLERYEDHYRGARSDGAVRGEVSQLRSVVREAARQGRGVTLLQVLGDVPALAVVLTT